MALSRMEGSIAMISSPLGRVFSLILTVVCYLSVGPLFATPRTATVSYEIGFSSFFGTSASSLLIYSIVYFAVVTLVSLYPNKLLDTVGHVLAPLKIFALAILGIAAVAIPSGYIPPDHQQLRHQPSVGRFCKWLFDYGYFGCTGFWYRHYSGDLLAWCA